MTTADEYVDFAVREACGVSPAYERLSLAVSRDDEVLALLDMLPPAKRQPNLLFGVVRLLGGPAEDAAEFRSFFSDLSPMGDAALRRTLRRNLPRPVSDTFAVFDTRPMAVGSVAQVHRAVLPGGDVVAVKVVKRGVRERLEASSWLLGKVLATVHAVAAPVRQYDLPGHFAELRPGRNFMASLLEQRVAEILGVPAQELIVVDADIHDPASDITVIVENVPGRPSVSTDQRAALRALDLPVDALLFARRRIIPRTTSGKKRYHECRRRLAGQDLTVSHTVRLAGKA
jgi:hypothetical protein